MKRYTIDNTRYWYQICIFFYWKLYIGKIGIITQETDGNLTYLIILKTHPKLTRQGKIMCTEERSGDVRTVKVTCKDRFAPKNIYFFAVQRCIGKLEIRNKTSTLIWGMEVYVTSRPFRKLWQTDQPTDWVVSKYLLVVWMAIIYLLTRNHRCLPLPKSAITYITNIIHCYMYIHTIRNRYFVISRF